jgi:hypothetical protein
MSRMARASWLFFGALACGDDDGDRGDDGSTTATGATVATVAPETSTGASVGTDASAGTTGSTGTTTSDGTTTTTGTTLDPDSGSDTGSDTAGTTGDPLGDCCMPHGTPGCSVPEIQECVCLVDAPCCVGAWDNVCVGEVEKQRCADCTP